MHMADCRGLKRQNEMKLSFLILSGPKHVRTKSEQTIKPSKEAPSYSPNFSNRMVISESVRSQHETRQT